MKKPDPGKVKTRLAKTIGDIEAVKIYEFLLHKTKQEVLQLNCNINVFYWPEIIEFDLWSERMIDKRRQVEGDLGQKMQHAFHQAFADGAERVAIIGTDCYELDTSLITKAFEDLKRHDVVIGPSEDGGYYLLGMNKLYTPCFQDKVWSTDTVFKDTLSSLETLNLTYSILSELIDIDEWEDLKRYPELLKNIEYPINHEYS